MSTFETKTWLDRIVQNPNFRLLEEQPSAGANIFKVSRAEGTVTQEGTPLNAQNFNDLESRIATAFAAIVPEYQYTSGRGEYLKFPSGTLICHRRWTVIVPVSAFTNQIDSDPDRWSITYDASKTPTLVWNFGHAFYNNGTYLPTVLTGYESTARIYGSIQKTDYNKVTFKLIYEGPKPSNETYHNIHALAIGRWNSEITI